MKQRNIVSTVFGSAIFVCAQMANAACVTPTLATGVLPANDVSLDGLAFELASAVIPAYEVDMNGMQGEVNGDLKWATHGTLTAVPSATEVVEIIASWTKNTYRTTEEWVCRGRLDPTGSSPIAYGDGAYHVSSGAFPTTTTYIDKCEIDLVNDCP